MSTATLDPPRVWIGCLAAYNSGHLHGEWADATDLDALRAVERRVIATSPADFPEETYLGDYEGFPAGLIGELTHLDTVAALALALREHGTRFAAFVDSLGLDVRTPEEVADAVERFGEAYLGDVEAPTLERAVGEFVLGQARELAGLEALEGAPWWIVPDVEATARNYMGEIDGQRVEPGVFALWRVGR